MSVSVHRCGNKITNISFFVDDKADKCKCGSRKMKSNCCKDKTEYVKLSDKQHKADNYSFDGIFFKKIANSIFNLYNINLNIHLKYKFTEFNSKPPDDTGHPIIIKNRVLLI